VYCTGFFAEAIICGFMLRVMEGLNSCLTQNAVANQMVTFCITHYNRMTPGLVFTNFIFLSFK
jgi:hypothetical protein